jgi:hypothetical protein
LMGDFRADAVAAEHDDACLCHGNRGQKAG